MKVFFIANFLLLFSFSLFSQQGNVLQLDQQNPHYFFYKNEPLLLIGSGEHYGSVINLDFDYKKYLNTLSKDGLNITRLFTGAYIEKPGDFGIKKNTLAPASERLLLPWQRSNVSGYTLGGNKFDLDKWDENYFTRLKDFIAQAQMNDIIVEVTLFSAHYAGGWNYSAFNPKNNINKTDSILSNRVNTLQNGNILYYQERYVRKIVKELNGFNNFYFEIQNEPWADQTDTIIMRDEYSDPKDWRSTIQVVSRLSNDWQKQIALWIKQEESHLPKQHLISQNISNFYYPVIDADSNVSIFNFHYAKPEAVWENYHLNRVIGFNETGFAGNFYPTYRKQAWQFVMAGGGLFNQLDYSFSVDYENGQDTAFSAPGSGGETLRKQLHILKQFFETTNFIELKPDRNIVKSAPAAFTEGLSNGHSHWIIYYEPLISNPNELLLTLPAGNYNIEWIDIVTGKIIEKAATKNGQLHVPAGGNEKVVSINSY